MNNLKNRRILIFQQRRWGLGIGHYLAKRLQTEGATLAAITFKKSTHEFTLKQQEVKYEFVLNNDEVMSDPQAYLKGDDYLLEEICQVLGVDSIWPLVRSLRNHVMSYQDKYYYSFRQNVSDEGIIDYVKALYKYLNKIFAEFKPQLILSPNFVALPHIMFNLFAKKKGIKMLAITDSKVQGFFIFTLSYKDNEGSFYQRVDALNKGEVNSPNRQRARQYINQTREQLKVIQEWQKSPPESLIKRIRHQLAPYRQIVRWYWHKPINYVKSTGITLDYRPPKIILRDHYAHLRYRHAANNFSYYPLEKVGKYAYFPLQFQPEATLDVLSPFFNNQLEFARLCAMSLPADYTLVVKEHPTMVGFRAPSYLEKISRTINVKLIDYRLPSQKVLSKASLVLSPGGTTLAEAAWQRIPAIQFGELGTTLKLPNVFKHTDFTTLAKKIKEVLAVNFDTANYEFKLENFVSAVYDTGFDFNYIKAWEKGGEDLERLWQVYYQEIVNNLL